MVVSVTLTYLARYYEQRSKSWKLRQTAVYHSYSSAADSHLFLLLHPREDSTFLQQLEACVDAAARPSNLALRPFVVHQMLMNSYVENWRLFLRDQGTDFITSADKLFALDMSTDHFRDISFEKLQWWRDLEDRIMPLTSILQASADVLDVLESVQATMPQASEIQALSFASRKGLLTALRTSGIGLQKRIHGALSLLRDTLQLKHQLELAKINRNLLRLQRENVDDNETVKVITIVTLIYLPASFVATLLGTNLFYFNPKTSSMRIAENFWWYVALFIPLTFVTILAWYLRTTSSRERRRRREQEMQVMDAAAFQMQDLHRVVQANISNQV